MDEEKRKIIDEEQVILDETINAIDDLLIATNRSLDKTKINKRRIDSKSVPDTYVDLLIENDREKSEEDIRIYD